MHKLPFSFLAVAIALLSCTPQALGAIEHSSQLRGGRAFQQQQHGGRTSSSSQSSSFGSTTRQYRNNTMLGDALVQIDPETRSLIIVADQETHDEIEKVINES